MLYAIVLGIIAGMINQPIINSFISVICELFIRSFKCISLPLIFLSIVIVLFKTTDSMKKIVKKTLLYTITTTLMASLVSCILYILIKPSCVITASDVQIPENKSSYIDYVINIVPSNMFLPYLEHNVMSVLFMGIVIGSAIRLIKDKESYDVLVKFFKGIHSLLLTIIQGLIKILPIGVFGFVANTLIQFKSGLNVFGVIEYIAVIIFSNLVQGFIVLPLWLKWNSISPFKTMIAMNKALSLAFFSKSSAGTLPVTIETAEKNLGIRKEVSRLVLPLCTTINMNGCAAFIFTTVIYLMQANGTIINFKTMFLWIFVSTVAAIGNAGVPMGCFFLSASLLASMDVPITLLGVILPFYGVIDMIETTLNVWSDSCVAKVVDKNV